jgi:hypothetical protein
MWCRTVTLAQRYAAGASQPAGYIANTDVPKPLGTRELLVARDRLAAHIDVIEKLEKGEAYRWPVPLEDYVEVYNTGNEITVYQRYDDVEHDGCACFSDPFEAAMYAEELATDEVARIARQT